MSEFEAIGKPIKIYLKGVDQEKMKVKRDILLQNYRKELFVAFVADFDLSTSVNGRERII